MNSRSRGLFAGLALAVLFASTGCAEKRVTVKGKLLKNGQPMVVSDETYVTISFVPEGAGEVSGTATASSAKFDQKTGTYTASLKPGKYRTMVVVALPAKTEAKKASGLLKVSGPPKVNAPGKPARSEKVYELTKDQELDIEVPG